MEKAIKKYISHYSSPIGLIEIKADEEAVYSIKLVAKKEQKINCNFVIEQAIEQLQKYFSKELTEFNFPIAFKKGTFFQQQVWSAVNKVCYGATKTYHEIANEINNSKAVRAVGSAINKNPLAIVIPCHRIVNKNHKIINYAYGQEKKLLLLNLEKLNNQ